jgi:hypothetical protein
MREIGKDMVDNAREWLEYIDEGMQSYEREVMADGGLRSWWKEGQRERPRKQDELLYIIYSLLSIKYYVLCIKYYVLSIMYYVLCIKY